MQASIDTRSLRLAAAALVVGLALMFGPAPAQAQDDGGFDIHYGAGFYVLGTTMLVATFASVGFLVADSVLAVHGRWLPPVAAGFELALAGAPWLVVAALALTLDGWNREAGALVLVAGLGFSAHAVASFELYDPSPPKRHERMPTEQARTGRGLRVAPWVGPHHAGASVFARF
jgi:hypothetical protein